jgi:hypothetical protein
MGGKIMKGWIGVDLDGTLAVYHTWEGIHHIGDPVPRMLKRVLKWLEAGIDVRIFTARVSPVSLKWSSVTLAEVEAVIDLWCTEHIGRRLPITHEKDLNMVELWDDRCVQVEPNTGCRVDEC